MAECSLNRLEGTSEPGDLKEQEPGDPARSLKQQIPQRPHAGDPASSQEVVVKPEVVEMVKVFESERLAERMSLFHAVVKVGVGTISFGLFLAVALSAAITLTGNKSLAIGLIVGMLLVGIGAITISTCNDQDLDIDIFLEVHPCVRITFCIVCALIYVPHTVRQPFLHALVVLADLAAACSWKCCCRTQGFTAFVAGSLGAHRPLRTTWLSCALMLIFLGNSGVAFVPKDGELDLFGACIGAWNLVGGAGLAVVFWWTRRQFRQTNGRKGASPTLAYFQTIYGWFTVQGIHMVLWGIYTETLFDLIRGIVLMIPVLLILAVGRKRLFGIVANLFDRKSDRVQRDGAFMAALLDGVGVTVGQTWWVHHGLNDERFPVYAPLRNFHQGVVVEIGDEEFSVELMPEVRKSFIRRSIQNSQRDPEAPRVDLTWLPLAKRGMPAEQLLQVATQNLLCIEWTSITQELMRGDVASADFGERASWGGSARPLRRGETIDFFMSHSWHDDAQIKWNKLTELAEAFHHSHGRYPTFWLDKVCIDQEQIGDGLKALPVNVMACRKMLVLCGHTYPTRLWCAWELCTLFAFMREESAHTRIHFVAMDSDSTSDVLGDLAKFDVLNAHCYDPNEEERLFEIIGAVGLQKFNDRIRGLAKAHQQPSITSKGTLAAAKAP